jgi:CRP/FNR family cyclic AMP-dependent transcriptional regulator
MEPRQMNEEGIDVRRNFQCVRGAVTKSEQVSCFGPFHPNGEVLLGHVRGGEWLGEMGVIEGRSRSAAAADGEVEVLTERQFFEQVSSDPALARDLILRFSIRLRRIEDKIAGDLLPFAHDRSPDAADETAVAVIAGDATILLAAQNEALRARIGAAAIHVAKLPFLAGRIPVESEAKPLRLPDLLIEDEAPFRLSRQHFVITRSGDRLIVSDVGSKLGTIVNGQAIGHHFTKDAAPLHRGENHVVAGGWDSPFEFLVSIS